MRARTSWLLAAATLAAACAGTAHAAGPAFDSRTILVKFSVPSKAAAAVRALGDRALGLTLNGVEVVGLDRGERVEAKVSRYRALKGVTYAEPNYIARAQAGGIAAPPNDPQFGSQWAWGTIRAVDAWAVYPGSYLAADSATIAVVDTGIDSRHPDLADGRVLTALGADCVASGPTCSPSTALDDNGHGTHVAGIAAAATNNGVGVAGMAYEAHVIPVKVLNSSASGSYAAITNGIIWASQHGARVINLSLGGTGVSQTLCDAVTTAIGSGSVVVASAGNDASSAANYPAACSGAVGVAATDSADAAASFSNFGKPDVFLAAPGVSVYSTYPDGSYKTMSGTSMAAPFVTGVAALLLGQKPGRTVTDVKTILAQSSDKVGSGYGADPYGTCPDCTWSSSFGYGRLDAYRALTAGAPPPSFTVSLAPGAATVDGTGTAVYTVRVDGSSGFAGLVELSVDGLPAGATAVAAPPSTTVPGTSRLVVRVAPGTAGGTYSFTVTGRSGALSSTATASLTVSVDAADFTIGMSPGLRYATAGLAAQFTIALGSMGGFVGPVDVSVAGLPAGADAVFLPARPLAPGATTLAILLGATTAKGSYTVTVTGASGALTHTATALLVVK